MNRLALKRSGSQFWRQIVLFGLLGALAFSSVRVVQGQSSVSAAPRVIASTPAQREVVNTSAAIQIIFDQPMDQASVESAFATTPKIDGKFAWKDDSTITFTPT